MTVAYILARIRSHNPKIKPEVDAILKEFLDGQFRASARAWGYTSVEMPLPTKDDNSPRYLLLHALKYHSREFLHKCLNMASSDDDLAGIMQDDEDKRRMSQVIADLSRLQTEAERLCSTYGVVLK